MAEAAEDHPLEAAILSIEDTAGNGGTVSVAELVRAFEDRSLGLLLTVAGLMVAIPVLGAVPGMPNVSALLVLFAVVRAVVGTRHHIPVPGVLGRRRVQAETVRAALEKARPVGRWIDGFLGRRLCWLVEGRQARQLLAVAAGVVALAMVVLSFVPFLSTPASLAIVLIGLALMARDGVAALLGLALGAVCLVLVATTLGSVL